MNLRRRHVPARSDVPRAWPGDVTDGDPVTATWRLRVRMDDRPGTLARVAIRLADLECNILGVTVLPVPGGVLDEIVVRPAPGITRADVIGALDHEDCECVGVADADVRELVDPAAASLGAAGRVVTAPEELADAVRDILAADVVTVVPDEEANPDRDETGHRGVFAVGDGRTLVARRRWAPFLHQELARAEALLALLTAVRTNLAGPTVVTCGDGAELVLRVGAVADTDAVVLLHEHCSPATLAGRYRDGMPGAADTGRRGVRDLLTPAHGTSVVAVCGREIVALGQLIDEPGSPAEVTLLVEDGWQRNGVGTALLRRLSDVASARGHDELVASARGNHDVLSRTAVRAGLDPAGSTDDGYLRVTISS